MGIVYMSPTPAIEDTLTPFANDDQSAGGRGLVFQHD